MLSTQKLLTNIIYVDIIFMIYPMYTEYQKYIFRIHCNSHEMLPT
ncbi:hypothetical protein BMW23_0458 [Bodo saltans virus]|uniref:Uncharacterized protein n=1 Tax=Bodo saltans virus TaxID=2024608 RepID=A0A2H4UUA5_9VIRU|nr:hypothetical protein QJ851_gp0447 [Bodo saltans virus]ATZ80510.1 hypothetical protein BMW23_0458 [Bodo saltans virus]